MQSKFKEAIRLFLIVLFVYTSASKLMNSHQFAASLAKLPLLKVFTSVFALGIPLVEAAVAVLLINPSTIKYGIKSSLILMISFTIYLGYALLSGLNLPCSCGGVISALSWKEHLYFNITVIGFSWWSLSKEVSIER